MSHSTGGTLSNDSIYVVPAKIGLSLINHSMNTAELITQGTGSDLIDRDAVELAVDELVDQKETVLNIYSHLKDARPS